jgi:hypothetical protein
MTPDMTIRKINSAVGREKSELKDATP